MSVYKTFTTLTRVFAAATICFGANSAGAAPITWGGATDIADDGDVSTTGALVAAYNLGGSAATLNGVTFKQFAIPPAQSSPFVPVTSVTVDAFYTLALFSFEHEPQTLMSFDTSSGNAPFTGLSSGYKSLLGTAGGQNFGDRTTLLTLADLTIGQLYELQVWVNDSSISGCCSFGISLSDGLNGISLDTNTVRDISGDVVNGGLGQYVIGTFMADGSSQNINFARGEIGGGLNGFQLRAVQPAQSVPEPATLALLGLGLAGLGFGRSRRAAATL